MHKIFEHQRNLLQNTIISTVIMGMLFFSGCHREMRPSSENGKLIVIKPEHRFGGVSTCLKGGHPYALINIDVVHSITEPTLPPCLFIVSNLSPTNDYNIYHPDAGNITNITCLLGFAKEERVWAWDGPTITLNTGNPTISEDPVPDYFCALLTPYVCYFYNNQKTSDTPIICGGVVSPY